MTARNQPRDLGKSQPDGTNAKRVKRGKPTNRDRWPGPGNMRDWLEHCDRLRQVNGTPSLAELSGKMSLTARTRVNDLLRGLSLPAHENQARDLLVALGATDPETERGVRLYKAAHAEQNQAKRDAGQPDWWLRSGYVWQIGHIAPLHLLGRRGELEELADWCTGGDEAYAWWQAEPWAGKSALMAWFVLHPPPGTWVVSFFVTARLAGQADSAAFTDSLLDQLAAVTGDQLPPVTSPTVRDGLRRHLLEKAAAQAVKAGRRLVLVVDGLDEDCGTLPGSGLASIATCLPKRPPAGLRVIVAGRPYPQLPADVDDDHPLSSCRVRPLDVSPHATRAAKLAQRELDEVLATDKNRHDGLGYEIFGLVTVSGGGLDHLDLQELTGRPAFKVDGLLRGVFGRTVAGRVGPDGEARVFLFAHEALREQAADRLGPGPLAGFAARLHAWADGYRHRGWPVGTPAYLLRGYPRMLAAAGDLDRLAALATDPARHHRMLDATGGDAMALSEITAAHALISSSPSPDLLASLRLAWYRNQLTDRNTHIPARLPAVWATLGQAARAEALAWSVTDPYQQAEALARLAAAVAEAGDLDRARTLAASAEPAALSIAIHGYRRERATAALATAMAATGNLDRAWEIAHYFIYGYLYTEAVADVAAKVAATGDLDCAQRIVRHLMVPYEQAEALAALAAIVAEAGDLDHARTLAASAEALAWSVTDPYQQAKALARLAAAAAEAGDLDHARALAASAEQAARSVTDPYQQAKALARLAAAAAEAGDLDHARALAASAEQAARSVTDPYQQAEALAALAAAAAEAGDLDRARTLAASAEALAWSVTDPYEQAEALTALAAALAEAGNLDHARTLAANAGTAARSVTDPYQQAKALTALAAAAAKAGDLDHARTLAASAEPAARTSPLLDDWAAKLAALAKKLAAMAEAPANHGDLNHAEQVTRTTTRQVERAEALARAALAVAEAGNLDRARALAARAEQVARSTTDSDARARALSDIASVAEPAMARSCIASALAAGQWTIPLQALACVDPIALCVFADEWIDISGANNDTG